LFTGGGFGGFTERCDGFCYFFIRGWLEAVFATWLEACGGNQEATPDVFGHVIADIGIAQAFILFLDFVQLLEEGLQCGFHGVSGVELFMAVCLRFENVILADFRRLCVLGESPHGRV
jgi:hypothetical protein